MKSKISQAKHRVMYNDGVTHHIDNSVPGAKYRTSNASKVKNFNADDTAPKYDKNTAEIGIAQTTDRNKSDTTNKNYGNSNNGVKNNSLKNNKYRLSTAYRDGKHLLTRELGDTIVNYTPDIYDVADKNQDMATYTAEKLSGNSFMVARTGYRGITSIRKKIWSTRKKYYDTCVGNKSRIKSAKMSRNLKYSIGLDIKGSSKQMFRNQSRKLLNRIAQNDESSTRIVGKSIRLGINSIKYRRQIKASFVSIKQIISSLINVVIGFVSSIPTIIMTVISSIPLMIIVIVITIIISLVSYQNNTSWGLQALYDYEPTLETEFGIEIDIVELSCVQDALGWSRGITYADVERLVAYYYIENPYMNTYSNDEHYCTNPHDAKKTDFDTGLKRIFNTRNPAKRFNNEDEYGVDSSIDKDDMTYNSIKSINLPDLNFYPEYKNLKLGNDMNNPEVRAYYGSETKINERIAFAKSRYNTNLAWSAIYGTTNELPNNEILENGTIAQKAVELGKAKLGCRYWWEAEGPTYFDCSGFIYWCYSSAGYPIQRGTADSYRKIGAEIPKDQSQLKEGDLLLIDWKNDGSVDHVVIYIGNNQIIGANGGNSSTHGDDPKACVNIKKLSYCWNKTVSIRRLVE